jgi:F-type H+-transporting ATPase subunit delta
MSTGPQTRQAAEAAIPGTVMDDEAAAGARSYAEALLNVAEKDGQADAVLGEIEEILDDVFRAHPEFAGLLAGPSLGHEEKDRVLVQLFEGRALPTVVRFLRVLNRHGRLGLLPMVAAQARALLDRRRNRRPVTVASAVPLDEGQQAALAAKLAAMLGAEPVVRYLVDPALLGGLVVQVGDEVYDASVRAQLERLRREVVRGKVHEVRGRLAESMTA